MKTCKNFYFLIYNQIKLGKYPNKIAKELDISRQKLNYYVSFLKQRGIIGKIDGKNYRGWDILKDLSEKQLGKHVKKRCKKKFSLGTRINKPKTNLHALQINFPILSGKVDDKEWEIKEKLNNWIPKYKKLENFGGLRVKNNNNKSITIFVKTRDIKNVAEIDNLAFKIRTFIFDFFKKKHNVILDVMECQTKNINIATEDNHSKEMLRKGERFELGLNKKAEKIFKKDNMDAKAWIDGSPYNFSAETNDKEWKRHYLQMPFNISGLAHSLPAIKEYSHQIKLHMKVQEKQLETQKEMEKTQKQLQELLSKLKDKM